MSQGGFPAAAGPNLRIPAPEQGEFARLYAPWALKVARRGAAPLKFTENLAHGLREIFVSLYTIVCIQFIIIPTATLIT